MYSALANTPVLEEKCAKRAMAVEVVTAGLEPGMVSVERVIQVAQIDH